MSPAYEGEGENSNNHCHSKNGSHPTDPNHLPPHQPQPFLHIMGKCQRLHIPREQILFIHSAPQKLAQPRPTTVQMPMYRTLRDTHGFADLGNRQVTDVAQNHGHTLPGGESAQSRGQIQAAVHVHRALLGCNRSRATALRESDRLPFSSLLRPRAATTLPASPGHSPATT